MKTEFYISQEVWDFNIGIKVRKGDYYASSITWDKIVPGEVSPSPIIKLSQEEAQELMNKLYALGIEPSKAMGSAGQLDSVKYHLEDMRKLVFK